jgi:arylsulfatase A
MAKLERRDFLKLMGLGAASLIIPGCSGRIVQTQSNRAKYPLQQAQDRPNIVFIMADDMGIGDTTVYNPDSKIPTPRLEQLAGEGVKFTDAHSSAAWCIPSRYGLLTGRYHWREQRQEQLGYYGPPVIKSGRLTVGELLQRQGYATACIGKWHLGMEWHVKDGSIIPNGRLNQQPRIDFTQPVTGGPLERGFDYFFGTSSCTTDDPPQCFIENDRVIGGIPVKVPDHTDEGRLMYGLPGWKHEDADIEFTKKSVAFIEKHVKGKPNAPFFLYLALSVPHIPWFPPDMVKGKSAAGDRGDQVVLADWSLGQVLDTLDRLNLTDNTLIIFTSDNGPREGVNGHRSAGHWRGYKQDLWEGGHRMPFIARWPVKIKPGTTSDETLCLTDMMATIAAITGFPLPDDAAEDSFNMLPALLGEPLDKPIREAIVHRAGTAELAIRRGDWKLILGRERRRAQQARDPRDSGQLYNLKKDPAEKDNLWDRHPDIVERLTKLLEKYKKQGHSRPVSG